VISAHIHTLDLFCLKTGLFCLTHSLFCLTNRSLSHQQRRAEVQTPTTAPPPPSHNTYSHRQYVFCSVCICICYVYIFFFLFILIDNTYSRIYTHNKYILYIRSISQIRLRYHTPIRILVHIQYSHMNTYTSAYEYIQILIHHTPTTERRDPDTHDSTTVITQRPLHNTYSHLIYYPQHAQYVSSYTTHQQRRAEVQTATAAPQPPPHNTYSHLI